MRYYRRFPDWLRRTLPENSTARTHAILRKFQLNTVCQSAKCPNMQECYSRNTATFMILGKVCTRHCGFCGVESGSLGEVLRSDEPERVAFAAQELGLKYIVITSVTRDDLDDEGAGHYAATVRAIKAMIPDSRVETLTPDFHASEDLIARVLEAGTDVFNHNLETVERLQKIARPQADYRRSLTVLETAKRISPDVVTKSGLMLGLGETESEVFEAGRHLLSAGVSVLTLGQYLRPTAHHLEVKEYISPGRFADLANRLEAMGFQKVVAGPYVRSSYRALETYSRLPVENTGCPGRAKHDEILLGGEKNA
ncbi:MAG: Lipoyl synthase [Candidatus Omnitrophica bacterium ADurb.Bin292]|nr:MAG: Lipoyl synthase [Candidatus Omnitrophica bacterium ADurb.Bin292]HPW76807.1 lipoyl synthase [Candidatus Omnitrophota bacterium]HQB12045.1 lipoyl synthase [Candidatus Omnitrophota bacterium]